MDTLLADPTWGSRISGGSVVGVGFNLGSDQRQCYIGIDYLKTSLLNSGNKIFFGKPGAQAVTFPTVAMGGATIGGTAGSAFAPPNGWTWGPAPPTIPPPEPYAQYGQVSKRPRVGTEECFLVSGRQGRVCKSLLDVKAGNPFLVRCPMLSRCDLLRDAGIWLAAADAAS
jgi:hypothetical protein